MRLQGIVVFFVISGLLKLFSHVLLLISEKKYLPEEIDMIYKGGGGAKAVSVKGKMGARNRRPVCRTWGCFPDQKFFP